MSSNGWIKLHRQFLDWEWYSDHNVCRLFLHCLMKANHKDKKWHGITINSGSFISSQGSLSLQTGLTVRQIRTSIDKLKSTGELTVKITNKYSLYSIACWENYQQIDSQVDSQSTNKRQASDKQVTTNKNVKNVKNVKNIIKTTKKSFMPNNFSISERVNKWASDKGYINLEGHLESFKLACESRGYKYTNWDSAFITAIRDDWAKLNSVSQTAPQRKKLLS